MLESQVLFDSLHSKFNSKFSGLRAYWACPMVTVPYSSVLSAYSCRPGAQASVAMTVNASRRHCYKVGNTPPGTTCKCKFIHGELGLPEGKLSDDDTTEGSRNTSSRNIRLEVGKKRRKPTPQQLGISSKSSFQSIAGLLRSTSTAIASLARWPKRYRSQGSKKWREVGCLPRKVSTCSTLLKHA